jgi:uncharacterized protein
MSEPGKPIVARWRDWAGESLEHLVLREDPDAIVVESAVLGMADGSAFAARYRIVCDRSWQVRRAKIGLIGDDRRIELKGDGAGTWRDGSGAALPQLEGAIDIDVTVTPFTNTLPIRRLHLERGQSQEIAVVYVHLPELTVTTDPQRYTCLEPFARYRFESLGGDFVREIEVDGHGLVVNYPGLFRRLLFAKGRDEQ